MNQHNFHQFNPNGYKKHLSPFGRSVLDTLIRNWRTGFDNNENRRRHQFTNHRDKFTSNQNRRQYAREFHGDSRPIPSVPSSPGGEPGCEINDETGIHRTTDIYDANNQVIPQVHGAQDYFHSSRRVGTNYAKETNQGTCCNDDNFAVPRLPVGLPFAASTFVGKYDTERNLRIPTRIANSNSLIQHHGAQNAQSDFYSNVLPEVPMRELFRDITNCCETSNEPVPMQSDLTKTVEIPDIIEEEILTANDMITPAINFNDINEKLLSSKKYINPNMPTKTFLKILNEAADDKTDSIRDDGGTKTKQNVIKNVDWDDMFDTEIFPNLKDPVPLITPVLEDNNNSNFKIEFPKDKKRKQRKSGNSYNKVTKCKADIKTSANLSKKIKKTVCNENVTEKTLKINLNKLNPVKAVKSWLNDLDTNKITEDEINQYDARDMIAPKTTKAHEMIVENNKNYRKHNKSSTSNANNETDKELADTSINKTSECLIQTLGDPSELNKDLTTEINEHRIAVLDKLEAAKDSRDKVPDKKPNTKNKRVVQARLAKKDGIMKFGLPTKGQNESKTEVTEDNETKSKEANKEKKVKSKFVPPIKSQIPVKNTTYDIVTIDHSNLHLIHDVMSSADIAMILIYKNGFCQLNNHHTEDTCVSDGIMIKSQEKYFYFKHHEQNSDLLRRLLENSQVICYNAKQMLIYLISKYGIELKQDVFNLFDAKIGGSLIDPDNPPENFAELQKLLDFIPEFTIATECVLQKTAWYITMLRTCFDKLKSLLIENCVWNVFVEIEMPLLPVIAGMEYRGVCVDLEKLKSMEEILLTKMKSVEQECYKAAGKTFQINSTLQVRTILYDELQLDTKSNLKIKETIGKGAKSTSETMLRGLVLVHPLPRLILEYRHLHKAHATFLTGIAQHVKDGSVKPTWVQMAAATGRIASNNPNLQAIPKAPFSLAVFPQDSDDQEPTLNFRSVYTVRPEHTFVAADFKHIECRVFAHAAEDATLQDALRSGQDLFRVLAAKWMNKSITEVSTEDRERTKRIVYASLYGAGARKLMEILNISYEQALSVMSSFNRTFPALKSFGRAVVAKAASGALRSLCGRARRFPHITSADAALRAQAERQAVNFIVQGSAADLCKKAMVAVQRRLESTSVASRLVLQIHDELVWEVADDHVTRAVVIIKDAMENVGRDSGMGMTLPVELTHGRNWGEMRPFE